MTGADYDEPGSRTRQAWLRTALGVGAVTVLVARGLVIRGLPDVVLLIALLPAAGFVAVAVARSRALGPHESDPVGRAGARFAVAGILALALVAAVTVLAAL